MKTQTKEINLTGLGWPISGLVISLQLSKCDTICDHNTKDDS